MEQAEMNFQQAAEQVSWQKRVDLYAGLPEVAQWELHLQEVKQRAAFGNAPEIEVIYVQRRYDSARAADCHVS
jgi:hypothetical protein